MSRRPYIRPVSTTGWWLSEGLYFRYMMRELSSLFIGAFAITLLVGFYRLSAALLGPVGTVFAIVTLVFALYHSYTWFQVTPKAMPIVLAGKRVPGFIIVAAHWVGFAVVTVVVWLLAVAR